MFDTPTPTRSHHPTAFARETNGSLIQTCVRDPARLTSWETEPRVFGKEKPRSPHSDAIIINIKEPCFGKPPPSGSFELMFLKTGWSNTDAALQYNELIIVELIILDIIIEIG